MDSYGRGPLAGWFSHHEMHEVSPTLALILPFMDIASKLLHGPNSPVSLNLDVAALPVG